VIPYVDFARQLNPLREELLAAASEVISSGQFILWEQCEKFEADFAELCQTEAAIAVNSGTDALVLVLKALGIGPGDEVIVPPNGFVASAASIGLVGATPVFADVRDDYNLDPDAVSAAVGPRTRAIMVVHLTGRPAPMSPLSEIAAEHNLVVIEDAAQAIAAELDGKRVGSFGVAGCFSLHPLKNLGALGDGGVITTNDRKLEESLRLHRNHGLSSRDSCDFFAMNSRLDEVQAAMLRVKLGHLEGWTERRRQIVSTVRAGLAGVPQVRVPDERINERAVYHTLVIEAERRDELRAHLEAREIGTAIHYPVPIHLQPAAAALGHKRGDFPVAEAQAARIVSLPVYPELEDTEVEVVIEAIRTFYASEQP